MSLKRINKGEFVNNSKKLYIYCQGCIKPRDCIYTSMDYY